MAATSVNEEKRQVLPGKFKGGDGGNLRIVEYSGSPALVFCVAIVFVFVGV